MLVSPNKNARILFPCSHKW